MLVVYPLDPLERRRADGVYAAEAAVCDRSPLWRCRWGKQR
jgi:hypothetical protein